jgi:hypothetical protein
VEAATVGSTPLGADKVKAATAESSAHESSEDASTISFGSGSYTVAEASGNISIALHINPISSTPVTLTVSSANIQAEALKDFDGLRQSLVIPPNDGAYTISVTIFDDVLVEGDEQLRLTLSNLQGVTSGAITETVVTIEDNDIAYLGVRDITVDEEAKTLAIVVTQSVTSTLESLVDLRTVEGSATAPEDFESLFTTVVIPPGSTAATVTMRLNGDEQVESVENFFIQLEDPTNAELGNDRATVTLIDDDVFPEIGLEPVEANETDGVLSFAVTLSSTWSRTVTVEYATSDGSAVAPDDYLPVTGTLLIAPGEVMGTVLVELVEDEIDEPDESFYLVLTDPVQAILNSNEVEGIIHDSFASALYLPGIER